MSALKDKMRIATPLAKEASKPAVRNCQTGWADFCLMAKHDGVTCPRESCDIDDGIRAAPSVEQDERGALTCRQIESVTYEEYAKRRGDESDLDCILKVVKRCLGVADEPRNVEGMTRAEFGQHLNVCLQHDNVRRKERGIPEMTSDAMEAEIKERVERNYPAKCQGCAAFDNPDALDVHFVQGCEGCKARMQKVAGFGPLCDARAASTSANVAQLDMSLEARLADAEADVKRLHAEKMELWNQVHGYSVNVAHGAEAVATVKVYETYTGQNGWIEVTQEEYDRTKDKYEHRIRRVPAPPAQTALTEDARDAIANAIDLLQKLADKQDAAGFALTASSTRRVAKELAAAQSASGDTK